MISGQFWAGFLLGMFAVTIVADFYGLTAASSGRSYYTCMDDGGTADHCRDKYLLWMVNKPTQEPES